MHHPTIRAMFGAIAMLAGSAHGATVDAGDYTRLPDGTNLAVLYAQHVEGKELYSQGTRLSGNARLSADIGILRAVRFIDVGDVTVIPQFLLPFGKLRTGGDLSGLSSTNGIGDLIFAPTVHLIQDSTRKRALAVTPWLYLPTGRYDRNNALNALGENRWKLDLQAGYITPLSDRWSLDLVGDVIWYGRNSDYGSAGATLRQSLSYQAQGHLRYHVDAGTYVAGMLSCEWGGETKVNGASQGDRQQRTKGLLSVGHFVTPTVQLLGSYGRDFSVRTGAREDHRFNLRMVKVF
ncbi:transporter [Duganella sp. FT92W]|uniref:Transporter n=1 Tax=Pseudoduganella rivuli TaxID=2666085 RepID=A0A7X2LS36_9BURK|nr:transporter [Pseudoduganella rivuli]MRV70394.1 transporter [Pseudoduganella rivuli]